MPVNSLHPEYRNQSPRWDLVTSIINNDATKWIRTVDIDDIERSTQYKNDAILTNFTALTQAGLTGLVFRRKPRVNLPESLNYLLDDSTGDDVGLVQFSQKVIGEVLRTGRYGVLVDYPEITSRLSLAQQMYSPNAARLKPYTAESIINWNCACVGDRVKLVLVVLMENIDSLEEDGFAWKQQTQYRVLQLIDDVYNQSVYDKDGKLVSIYTPTKSDGSLWNEIPFKFIGSENNDSTMDKIPLYDLAVVNLGHYRNSADYEESIFVTGQPTIFLRGDGSQEEFKAAYPKGIRFGSRAGYYLGATGGADLIQANPNQLADNAMRRKEEQALAIGARLIAPPGGRETAEAARIRFASQNSALYLITTNISEGIKDCLEWVNEYMSNSLDKINFVLNDEFYDDAADPNLIAQQIMLLDKGIIAKNDIRDYVRKTGVIDDERTNVELDLEATPEPTPTSIVPIVKDPAAGVS